MGFSFYSVNSNLSCCLPLQKVGACPGAKDMLLGMEQCTLGPDYWCKNMVTATKCNVSILDESFFFFFSLGAQP